MKSALVVAVLCPVLLAFGFAWAETSRSSHDHGAHGLRVQTTVLSDADALPAVRAPARGTATWCGTPAQADLTPNTRAGVPVHWIYAVPSDGGDRFASFANTMQTDAEEIDAWWRREDPARAPRND